MSNVQARLVELAPDEADYVDRKIASGEFADEGEVMRAGLRLLRERDEEDNDIVWPLTSDPEFAWQLAEHPDRPDQAIDDWLRREVVPVVEAMRANPSSGIPAAEVFDEIRALHEDRTRRRLKDA